MGGSAISFPEESRQNHVRGGKRDDLDKLRRESQILSNSCPQTVLPVFPEIIKFLGLKSSVCMREVSKQALKYSEQYFDTLDTRNIVKFEFCSNSQINWILSNFQNIKNLHLRKKHFELDKAWESRVGLYFATWNSSLHLLEVEGGIFSGYLKGFARHNFPCLVQLYLSPRYERTALDDNIELIERIFIRNRMPALEVLHLKDLNIHYLTAILDILKKQHFIGKIYKFHLKFSIFEQSKAFTSLQSNFFMSYISELEEKRKKVGGCHLQSISIENCKFDAVFSTELVQKFSNNFTKLKRLNLVLCSFSNEIFWGLFEGLQHFKTLKFLQLKKISYHKILPLCNNAKDLSCSSDDHEGSAFSKPLPNTSKLSQSTMNLRFFTLVCIPTLVELSLTCALPSDVGDKCFESLFSSLRNGVLRELKILKLDNNQIEGRQGNQLAQSIQECPDLMILSLNNNQLEGEAITSLIINCAKKGCKKLFQLWLAHNGLSARYGMQIVLHAFSQIPRDQSSCNVYFEAEMVDVRKLKVLSEITGEVEVVENAPSFDSGSDMSNYALFKRKSKGWGSILDVRLFAPL